LPLGSDVARMDKLVDQMDPLILRHDRHDVCARALDRLQQEPGVYLIPGPDDDELDLDEPE
jgi:hypothetical protein